MVIRSFLYSEANQFIQKMPFFINFVICTLYNLMLMMLIEITKYETSPRILHYNKKKCLFLWIIFVLMLSSHWWQTTNKMTQNKTKKKVKCAHTAVKAPLKSYLTILLTNKWNMRWERFQIYFVNIFYNDKRFVNYSNMLLDLSFGMPSFMSWNFF